MALDVDGVRQSVNRDGVLGFTVDDLRADEVPSPGWSGGPLHLRAVAHEVERAARREADYLVVRTPDGVAVSKGGVDYGIEPGTGWIWQVATHPELEGLGLARLLMGGLEQRIQDAG